MNTMKRFLLLSTFLGLFSFQPFAQIIISSGDMPVPGDTLRRSNTFVLDGIDYLSAGPDQTWLFDELTVVSQQVDTFVNVSETPSLYQIFFNNQFIYPDYKATVAQKLTSFSGIPGLTLEDTYLFIKNTDEEIREVGYGVTLDGIPLPIQFQQIDTIFRFPLEYGDIDSAHSMFQVDVPDLGFLLMSKSRRNTVDGWGTLTTPYGEFQTLRVKTEITEYDSLYSDSLGVGIPVIRNYIEYKWLANGYHEPLLVVTDEAGIGVTASYIDSVRSTFLEVPRVRKPEFSFNVFPNPCRDYISVSYELKDNSDVTISVYSIFGNEIKRFAQARQERGLYNQVLYLKESGFRSGVYLVKMTINNIPCVRRIVLD
jgi:hypothetical protein